MCRSQNETEGGRRCPSHRNPILQRLASAVQRISRWERRFHEAEAAGDADRAAHAMEKFTAALTDVQERSEWDPQWDAVPPPTRCEEFTRERLAATPDDTLEAEWAGLYNDPKAQRLIEGEWDRRDAADREARERTAQREAVRAELTPDLLSSADQADLERRWGELADDRELQELIEHEWDRREQADGARTLAEADQEAADSADLEQRWGQLADEGDRREEADATRALAQADQDAAALRDSGQDALGEMSGADMQELQWAYENLSPAKYREVERRILTDPSMWTPEADTVRGPTVRERAARLSSDYHEWQFERYIAAENHCRGHMLNRRGQAAGVDPQSLMFGNSKRMQAYASDEFKSFVGSTGGHMSLARFRSQRGDSTTGAYAAHNTEVFNDVARV